MSFKIDLKIFILLVLFYFTKQIHIYACLMLFAMIHEMGHLLAGLLLGMKPEKIEIKPFGFSINFRLTTKDYNKKIHNSFSRTYYKFNNYYHSIKHERKYMANSYYNLYKYIIDNI